MQDRISWAAALLLTIFAYVGIMLGVSALRKIERQLVINEHAIQAASESSKAALDYLQAQVRPQERPWDSRHRRAFAGSHRFFRRDRHQSRSQSRSHYLAL